MYTIIKKFINKYKDIINNLFRIFINVNKQFYSK